MFDPVRNFAKVTVSTGYGSADTNIILSSGQGALLPDPGTEGAFNLTWWDSTDFADPTDDPNVEIVRVTAPTGDTLTVTRGQGGTTPTTKNTSSKVYKMILALTKKMITDIPSQKANSGANTDITSLFEVNLKGSAVVTLADAATIATDASLGNIFYVTS